MIEPTIEALTTSCSPAPSAKRAMMSSGALPKVTFSRPPIPGPERTASSSVARPMSAAVGMTPSAEAKKVTTAPACASSKHDRDRDEGDQQVRPALAGHEESAHGRRRRLLADEARAALSLREVDPGVLHALLVPRVGPAEHLAHRARQSDTGRACAGAPIACSRLRSAKARSKRTRPVCGALPLARSSAGTSKRTRPRCAAGCGPRAPSTCRPLPSGSSARSCAGCRRRARRHLRRRPRSRRWSPPWPAAGRRRPAAGRRRPRGEMDRAHPAHVVLALAPGSRSQRRGSIPSAPSDRPSPRLARAQRAEGPAGSA